MAQTAVNSDQASTNAEGDALFIKLFRGTQIGSRLMPGGYVDTKVSKTESIVQGKKILVDPKGDIVLVVKDEVQFLVSSVLMSAASTVFKTMLGPHFMEGSLVSSTSPGHIQIVEDDTKAMLAILSIIHHRHDLLMYLPPRQQDRHCFEEYRLLDNLLVLSDKYDCLKVIQYWTSRLLSFLSDELRSTRQNIESKYSGLLKAA